MFVEQGQSLQVINMNNADVMQRFNELLLDMYETGDKENLKRFLYENAIIGILTSV